MTKKRIDFDGGHKEFDEIEPLKSGERGLILYHCPQYTGEPPFPAGQNGLGFHFPGQTQVMRGHDFYPFLLFFDRIDCPSSANIHADPEFAVLMERKLVQGFSITTAEMISNAGMRRDSFEMYRLREREQPGAWSIFRSAPGDPIPPDQQAPDLAFKLRLQNAFLIPDPNTPVDDLLAFRERNRKELIAFRHHLEEVCIVISRGGFHPHEMGIEVEKLEGSLQAINEAARMPNLPKILAGIDVRMNFAPAAAAAFSAFAAGADPVQISLSAGAAFATSLTIEKAIGSAAAGSIAPFDYFLRISDLQNGIT